MADICFNRLSVEGPRTEITRFRGAVRGCVKISGRKLVRVDFHLGGLVPLPFLGQDPAADEALDVFYAEPEDVLDRAEYINRGLTTIKAIREDLLRRNPDAKRVARAYARKLDRVVPNGWREWCYDNWGTTEVLPRGEASFVLFDNTHSSRPSPKRLEYWFHTRWNPPYAWLLTVSKMFPALTLYLRWELGSEAESLTIRNGEGTDAVRITSSRYRGNMQSSKRVRGHVNDSHWDWA